MKCSTIVQQMPASGIRKIFEGAIALERKGVRVLRLDVGRPDFDPPPQVVEATKRALDEGLTRYVGNRGLLELREAIAAKLARENGLAYDPATDLVVTSGASEAVAAAMFAVLEPGSEVLVPQPLWPHYVHLAKLAGATPVAVPLSFDDGFALSPDLLKQYISPQTRLLVLNSPCNPTGKVYDRRTLEQVLAFAEAHDLLVLADEIYEYFSYDKPFTSFASLPGARERTLLVNGFSKAFGMTGFRLGYLAAPAGWAELANKPHQYISVCSTAFAQRGAVAAYRDPEAANDARRKIEEIRRRRQILLEEISRAREIEYLHPAGAFYFFPRLPDDASGSNETATRLLEEAGIAVVPGSVFGEAYDRFLRISYGSCSPEDLRLAMRRIVELLYC